MVVHAARARPEVNAAAKNAKKNAAARVDDTLAALADPTRRAVIELLRRGPKRAGELADALAISAPTLSRHMRVLRRSGLVADEEPEHDARVRLYSLQPQAFASLRDWLDEVEAFWSDQLAAFKAHAEQPRRRGR